MNRVALRVWQLSAPKFKSLTAVSYASNSDKIKEKGKGDQENYFSKEDRKKLKELMSKIPLNQSEAVAEESECRQQVQNILSRYKVTYTEALVQELVNWKNK